FAVLAYGWGRVGGLSALALQLPYAISAGCGGLGLIVAGALLVGLQGKRREAAAREEVVVELRRVVAELERLAGERSPRWPASARAAGSLRGRAACSSSPGSTPSSSAGTARRRGRVPRSSCPTSCPVASGDWR